MTPSFFPVPLLTTAYLYQTIYQRRDHGGRFPWLGTYTPGLWRTSNTTYLDAYAGYIQAVGSQIAANEITKGGPVILVQVKISRMETSATLTFI